MFTSKFFQRFKLHYIFCWILYHYLILVVAFGNPLKAIYALQDISHAIRFSFYVIFQAIAVSINLYVLIPRFLARRRYLLYSLNLSLTIILSASIIVSGYYLGALLTSQSFETIYGPGTYCLYFFFSNALPSTMASMGLAMCIKLTSDWMAGRRRQQLLEREKLETELNFLKNQFNPHFVFNTINSIFFLIHRNPDKASVSLAKFSELLRYQLYECNEKYIPLNREIAFVENSIELERLRLNSNVKVDVNLNSSRHTALQIAPFILMAFIENAFKHVSKEKQLDNRILISIDVTGRNLMLQISNSIMPDEVVNIGHSSGIGLKNVQRRLELMYEAKHELCISTTHQTFDVQLKLLLDAAPVRETAGMQSEYQIA